MYSVVYPESDFGELFRNGSGMVPESNFGGFSGMVPEWFRKRSMYRLRIHLIRIQFPVALSANIRVTLCVVLSSYFGGPFKCLKEYVGLLHNPFLGLPENIRLCSGESCRTESISVVVVTIWLRVMA